MRAVQRKLFLKLRKNTWKKPIYMPFLALDFPQLLDALGKRLKFHINIKQGLKKFLNDLLDLSFY